MIRNKQSDQILALDKLTTARVDKIRKDIAKKLRCEPFSRSEAVCLLLGLAFEVRERREAAKRKRRQGYTIRRMLRSTYEGGASRNAHEG
jgi:hypothetical protein